MDAAKKARVGNIFLMSAAGTKKAADSSLGGAYWKGEQHLIGNITDWTILRMNYYAESMADEIKASLGMGALTGLGQERVAYVSREDVAAAAAGALQGEGHEGSIYNLTGPQIVTGQERAAIVSKLIGRPLGFAVITPEQLRAGLAQAKLPEIVIEAILEIKFDFVEGKFDIVTTDVARLSGRNPKPFQDVLAAALNEKGSM